MFSWSTDAKGNEFCMFYEPLKQKLQEPEMKRKECWDYNFEVYSKILISYSPNTGESFSKFHKKSTTSNPAPRVNDTPPCFCGGSQETLLPNLSYNKLSYCRVQKDLAMHYVSKLVLFHGVWVRKVSNSKKVTFKVILVYWQLCHSTRHIRCPISASLQLCLYPAPLTR